MGAAAIVALLMQVITMLPELIQAGIKIEGLIARVTTAVQSGSVDPTDVQWTAVNKELDDLTARLNVDPPAAPV